MLHLDSEKCYNEIKSEMDTVAAHWWDGKCLPHMCTCDIHKVQGNQFKQLEMPAGVDRVRRCFGRQKTI